MSTQSPLVSASGIWCAYLTPHAYAGDNAAHQVLVHDPASYGNETLFENIENGVSMTHRALVNVDVHASCSHEVAIERDLMVQLGQRRFGRAHEPRRIKIRGWKRQFILSGDPRGRPYCALGGLGAWR